MDKIELKKALEDTREELWGLIKDIPEEDYLEPGVMDDWSLKDILAHLNRWEGLSVTLLWKLKQGRRAERLDIRGQEAVDELNAEWYEEDEDRSLDLVLSDFKGLRRQTLRRLDEFNDEELNDPSAFDGLRDEPLWKWVAVDTFEHEREHIPAIKDWIRTER